MYRVGHITISKEAELSSLGPLACDVVVGKQLQASQVQPQYTEKGEGFYVVEFCPRNIEIATLMREDGWAISAEVKAPENPFPKVQAKGKK